jgi:RHS repeat-associated protein
MRLRRPRTSTVLFGALITLAASREASAANPLEDQRVQAPNVRAPDRGSVAGSLAKFAPGPSDVARGAVSLPPPFVVPTDRGELLARVLPAYSSEGELTEWGLGWSNDLALRRHRNQGDLDFATDELTGPWGPMKRGTDGAWYPAGLGQKVRVTEQGGGYTALLGDGTRYEFSVADSVFGPRGTTAWMMTSATTPFGERTELVYERNASGRPFLTTARYGGRGGPRQYEIELVYETLTTNVVDFRTGAAVGLDRRVRELRVKARASGTGAYVTRYAYQLAYQSSATGPAFYLSDVTKTYASGSSDPKVHYDYDVSADALAQAAPVHVSELDAFLAQAGSVALEPSHASPVDIDEDGLVDFEHAYAQSLIHRTANGFTVEPLAPKVGGEDPICRPAPSLLNPPRSLARMWPEAQQPHVLAAEYDAVHAQTSIHVCDRPGFALTTANVTGDWRPSATTRLVDVNRDGRPDLVRVLPGSYQVLENKGNPGAIAWTSHPSVALAPVVSADTTWVHDMNGDGLPDLVARYASGLAVWHGHGQLDFEPNGASLAFYSASNALLSNLATFQITFLDANRDGLTDALLTKGTSVFLFLNRGDSFRESPLPGLASLPAGAGYPISVDVSASGEEEIVFPASGKAYAVRLTRPSTGLITSADDGMGTRVRFDYGRGPAAVHVGARPAVLVATTRASAGDTDLRSTFAYANPVAHSVGKFLLGFTTVTKSTPLVTDEVTFHHDDDLTNIVVASQSSDARTPVVKFTSHAFEEVVHKGLRVMRPTLDREGVRAADGAESATVTSYAGYERDLCPTVVTSSAREGDLTTMTTLAHVASLDDELHCLPESKLELGTHADPSLDFVRESTIERNDAGQAVTLLSEGQVKQQVAYDAQGRVVEVASPGKGSALAEYSPTTGLLARATAPDGTSSELADVDPVTDQPRDITTKRGANVEHHAYFAYDPLERFSKRWDDLGASSASDPLEQASYTFANAMRPAKVAVHAKVADGAHSDAASLRTGSGEEIAKLKRTPEGWASTSVIKRDVSAAETRELARPPLPASVDPGALGFQDLLAGTTEVASRREAGFGHVVATSTALQVGVQRDTTTNVGLVGGDLVAASTENGALTTQEGRDEHGRVVWSSDGSGAVTSFQYDTLGRLVGVTQPDGAQHRVRFDGQGRPAFVERDGIGSIAYGYDKVTGQLTTKSFFSASGFVERAITWERDAQGRPTSETHTLASTGATRVFLFDYDGADSGEPGQLGHLTRVRGPGYEKRWTYDRDGALASAATEITGFRTVSQTFERNADRSVKSTTTTLFNEVGKELERVVQDHDYDVYGRLHAVMLNGQTLLKLAYDAEGRPATISFAEGESLTMTYDPLTKSTSGYAQAGGTWTGGASWTWNARGTIDSETIATAGVERTRFYGYDARGFLTAADDDTTSATYAYDQSGLPTGATDTAGDRSLVKSGGVIEANGVTYAFDDLGRLVTKGDLTLEYGPTGEVELAHTKSEAWGYLYDEAGQRLAKTVDGVPVGVLVAGGYLTATTFSLPVRVLGRSVGVIEHGAFRTVATDPRGTVIDTSSSVDMPTSYGVRSGALELAEVLDYVEKGHDPALGTVRMGKRDYDPILGQFTTPDPAFLEDLNRCLESPSECNLYGYARNNPILYVDPTGEGAKEDKLDQKKRDFILKQKPEDLAKVFGSSVVDATKYQKDLKGCDPASHCCTDVPLPKPLSPSLANTIGPQGGRSASPNEIAAEVTQALSNLAQNPVGAAVLAPVMVYYGDDPHRAAKAASFAPVIQGAFEILGGGFGVDSTGPEAAPRLNLDPLPQRSDPPPGSHIVIPMDPNKK